MGRGGGALGQPDAFMFPSLRPPRIDPATIDRMCCRYRGAVAGNDSMFGPAPYANVCPTGLARILAGWQCGGSDGEEALKRWADFPAR